MGGVIGSLMANVVSPDLFFYHLPNLIVVILPARFIILTNVLLKLQFRRLTIVELIVS